MREIGRAVLAAAAMAAIGLGAAACSSAGVGASASPTSAGDSAGAQSGTPGADTAASGQPSGSLGSPAASASAASTAKSGPANYPVDLQPSTAAPGSQVMVYGLSCSDPTGTATSNAFTAPIALSMISNATGGGATVKSGLAAGSYTVTVTCGKITATGTLNVS